VLRPDNKGYSVEALSIRFQLAWKAMKFVAVALDFESVQGPVDDRDISSDIALHDS
jgi:hypothetical protein